MNFGVHLILVATCSRKQVASDARKLSCILVSIEIPKLYSIHYGVTS
jgi:hypothetical protein